MNKLFYITIFYLYSSMLFAECTQEQSNIEIDVEIIHQSKSVKAGGDHGFMDEFEIKAPAVVSGIPVVAMELTTGEVSEFWIPVAFKIIGESAVTSIVGYSKSINNFEIVIYYQDELCHKSVQYTLQSHSKQK